MSTLYGRLVILACLISLISCKSRKERDTSYNALQPAQWAAMSSPLQWVSIVTPDIKSSSIVPRSAHSDLKRLANKGVKKTVIAARQIVKEEMQRLAATDGIAKNPALKKQEVRLADILFFVVLAILLTTVLVILKQKGLATEVMLFIAMGAALIIAIAYIYFHTWIFTA